MRSTNPGVLQGVGGILSSTLTGCAIQYFVHLCEFSVLSFYLLSRIPCRTSVDEQDGRAVYKQQNYGLPLLFVSINERGEHEDIF